MLQNANLWSVSSISKGIHELGHGGLENQNVDIENTSCLSMTSSNVSLPVCRICQLPGVEPSNPLISPCRCLGSIRYVHNNCLLVSTYLFHHLVYQNFWKLSNFDGRFLRSYFSGFNTQYMTNPTIVSPVKMKYGWNFSISGLKWWWKVV